MSQLLEEIIMNIYGERRNKIAETINDNSLLFLFSGHAKQKSLDQDFPFAPDRNFYYMTGLKEEGLILLISKKSSEIESYLFVPRPDPYLERYTGHMDTDKEYAEKTGIDNVIYLDKMEWNLSRFLSRNYYEYLYLDFHKRDLDFTACVENEFSHKILAAHPYLKTVNCSREICNMRRIKSEDEIVAIKNAIRITGYGIRSILEHKGDGCKENELQAHFEFALKYYGAMGNAFSPIIASGPNSNILHYDKNCRTMKDGEVLLLDLGAEYDYYSADISRTFPIGKEFTERQRLYYEAVLYGQNQIQKALRPGFKIDDTLKIARKSIFERCKDYGLIHKEEEMNIYLPHGVCHYMGLDTHDVGDTDVLLPGMVVTMEPGIYLKEYGFGIRIEDDVLITEDGCECLSDEIPKTIEEIKNY